MISALQAWSHPNHGLVSLHPMPPEYLAAGAAAVPRIVAIVAVTLRSLPCWGRLRQSCYDRFRFGDDRGRAATIVSVLGTIAAELLRSFPFWGRLRQSCYDRFRFV